MSDSGCYQLKIRIKSELEIEIGALGKCRFEKGEYVYTGSAMKNLEKRVARHRRKDKKTHWHIDYLLAHAQVELSEALCHPSASREECLYNQQLLIAGAKVPVKGFGSSDCRICPSHLVRIDAH